MASFKVTSEIYEENRSDGDLANDSRITKINFRYPSFLLKDKNDKLEYDEDGDLIVDRVQKGTLMIEHHISTDLHLVGLQLWRGAFLLADYILSNSDLFENKTILELGSGVGFTSIIASILAKKVICTDINEGEILKLIAKNFKNNKKYIKSKVDIKEMNFLNLNWSQQFCEELKTVEIILAADVIYDDNITEGFVNTLEKLFNCNSLNIAYVALEKRFVFTLADLDSVAPMYEEFLRCIAKKNYNWTIEEIKLDFPQYFRYDRLKQMILMKIKRKF
ncbi:methyltransferase-like protein 22 [Leptopilina boulardi]|uniref:methyltransferase-like protein 22 n=1 Tax=Leptopilina boulardi TaxID=63433 RepID=UPI0021F6863D|nr:methyltransferase-like protein 22 [Leptopilina boulardi]XP_051168714.1 methyltransferase-like protein 22 [Leptopilina boulardi]